MESETMYLMQDDSLDNGRKKHQDCKRETDQWRRSFRK